MKKNSEHNSTAKEELYNILQNIALTNVLYRLREPHILRNNCRELEDRPYRCIKQSQGNLATGAF